MAHEVISVWEKMGYSPFDINVETRCIASDGLKYVFILAERKGAENLWSLIGGTDAIHRVPTECKCTKKNDMMLVIRYG